MDNYKNKKIMINHGYYEVGTYGKYSYRGEILHMHDSYIYGNSKEEVLKEIKDWLDKNAK